MPRITIGLLEGPYLELKLENGHDVLLEVIHLPRPPEARIHVRPELILQKLVDGRPRGYVLPELGDFCRQLESRKGV